MEDQLDEIITLRAGLGTWVNPLNREDRVYITSVDEVSLLKVEEHRRDYAPIIRYQCNHKEAQAKIKTLQQQGYILERPQFPELSQFFRNGKPITAADELADAINTIKVVPQTETWLEELMNNWK